MWVGRGLIVIMAALWLGGCAGGQANRELGRLQSHVGLLDDRVSQLERSSQESSGSVSEAETESAGSAAATASAPTGAVAPAKAPESTASIKPTMREIQQSLKNAGFYQGPVDGKKGPMTREAVKEFQRVHGLTDDGVVGKKTWAKLRSYLNLSANTTNSGEATAAEPLK